MLLHHSLGDTWRIGYSPRHETPATLLLCSIPLGGLANLGVSLVLLGKSRVSLLCTFLFLRLRVSQFALFVPRLILVLYLLRITPLLVVL